MLAEAARYQFDSRDPTWWAELNRKDEIQRKDVSMLARAVLPVRRFFVRVTTVRKMAGCLQHQLRRSERTVDRTIETIKSSECIDDDKYNPTGTTGKSERRIQKNDGLTTRCGASEYQTKTKEWMSAETKQPTESK